MAARLFQVVTVPSLQEGWRLLYDFVASRNGEAMFYRWQDNYVQMS
jgi:hypothetical protein